MENLRFLLFIEKLKQICDLRSTNQNHRRRPDLFVFPSSLFVLASLPPLSSGFQCRSPTVGLTCSQRLPQPIRYSFVLLLLLPTSPPSPHLLCSLYFSPGGRESRRKRGSRCRKLQSEEEKDSQEANITSIKSIKMDHKTAGRPGAVGCGEGHVSDIKRAELNTSEMFPVILGRSYHADVFSALIIWCRKKREDAMIDSCALHGIGRANGWDLYNPITAAQTLLYRRRGLTLMRRPSLFMDTMTTRMILIVRKTFCTFIGPFLSTSCCLLRVGPSPQLSPCSLDKISIKLLQLHRPIHR